MNLIEEALRPWNWISAWLIEYDWVGTSTPPGAYVKNVMATREPGDYYKLRAVETGSYPWESDPLALESFLHEGRRTIRWPFRRSFSELSVEPGDALLGSVPRDVLWRVIPHLPMTLYRLPNLDIPEVSPVLGRSLSSGCCRLLSYSEIVNGKACRVFVLNDGRVIKKTWIATRLGLCLMKEEVRDAHSNRLIQRIITEEIGEPAPRLWMPMSYRIQWFEMGASSNVLAEEIRVRIRRILLNDDVPSSTFVPVYSAGSIKTDGNTFTQIRPGGEDLLLNVIGFMKEYGQLPTAGAGASSFGSHLWSLAGLMCGFGLAMLLPVRWRDRTRPAE